MRRSGATLRFSYGAPTRRRSTWVPSVGVARRRANVSGGATQRWEKKKEEDRKRI
tara:strand:- start:351 stop:515 length:165 start_codon:yes stop_codon:yes gene_type:complete